MSTAYGTRPIKRRRRTKGAIEQLERQILEVLEEDHPQSVVVSRKWWKFEEAA